MMKYEVGRKNSMTGNLASDWWWGGGASRIILTKIILKSR